MSIGEKLTKLDNKIDEVYKAGVNSVYDYKEDLKGIIERTTTNPKLPDDLTEIGNYAFTSSTKLALTELPKGITYIGNYAFYSCKNLALTELPDALTEIGDKAFVYCTNLALTELPDALTEIGDKAFIYCTNLKSITFRGTPKTIVSTAFTSCKNLKEIRVPWAEGEVAYAPWGATNATIWYNAGQTKLLNWDSSYYFGTDTDGALTGTAYLNPTGQRNLYRNFETSAYFAKIDLSVLEQIPYTATLNIYHVKHNNAVQAVIYDITEEEYNKFANVTAEGTTFNTADIPEGTAITEQSFAQQSYQGEYTDTIDVTTYIRDKVSSGADYAYIMIKNTADGTSRQDAWRIRNFSTKSYLTITT